jgi:hypothetical protein
MESSVPDRRASFAAVLFCEMALQPTRPTYHPGSPRDQFRVHPRPHLGLTRNSNSGHHAVAKRWVFFQAETWVFFNATSTLA